MSKPSYSVKTVAEHVLHNPTMYVGAVDSREADDYVYNAELGTMEKRSGLLYNEGLLKIISEALDNAFDNAYRGETPTRTVWLDITPTTVTVSNDGEPVSLKRQDFGKNVGEEYIPTVLFGCCLSGSNFGESREGAGMNGIGIKAANILSRDFKVTAWNPGEDSGFEQSWGDHMRVCDKAVIKKCRKKVPSRVTTVTFTPDVGGVFTGLTSLVDVEPYIITRLVEISATHPKPVRAYYNGKLLKVPTFKSYVKLFVKPGEPVVFDQIGDSFEWGLRMSDTGVPEQHSFVNTLRTTSDRSTHVRLVLNRAVQAIQEQLGGKVERGAVVSKLHVFVNLRMNNPVFTSQTKVELSTPMRASDYPIDVKRIVRVVTKGGLLKALKERLERRELAAVHRELDVRTKKRTVVVDKLDDAHDAGTSGSPETTLFLVEGDSAKTFATIGLSVLGRKRYGIFPLRGKLLNVRKASREKLKGNVEVKNLMEILGLSTQRRYEKAEDLRTLRYGHVCILTDADQDGHHITGLILNFFHTFWPALLAHPTFLQRFVTPIIRVRSIANRSKEALSFFSTGDFESWATGVRSLRGWRVQHLKGLGTSERADVVQYFRAMEADHLRRFSGGEAAGITMDNIFNPTKAAWRKEWLALPPPAPRGVKENPVCMDSYLNTEVREYSRYALVRATASVVDGFKVSQRKILYACLRKFTTNNNTRFKVAQLGAYCAAETNYAHGEESLHQAIIKMAQDFPGSNNTPLLLPLGAFGSRLFRGDDAASPRYVFTQLAPTTRALFPAADDPVLEVVVEEGMEVGPSFYCPCLPTVLLNGARGIGTGFSSFIPSFKPSEVRRMVLALVRGEELTSDPLPWYRGYGANERTWTDGKKWYWEGEYEARGENEVVVHEIPIFTSMEAYMVVLAKMRDAGAIAGFEVDHVDENTPRYVIRLTAPLPSSRREALEFLNLIKAEPCTNMNLLDETGTIQNFANIRDIARAWYRVRTQVLVRRKENRLRVIAEEVCMLENKVRFLRAIVRGVIDLRRGREAILSAAAQAGVVATYHTQFLQMPILSIGQEKVLDTEATLLRRREELQALEQRSTGSLLLEDIEAVPLEHDDAGEEEGNPKKRTLLEASAQRQGGKKRTKLPSVELGLKS